MGDEYDQTTLYDIPKELIQNRGKVYIKQEREVLGVGPEEWDVKFELSKTKMHCT